MKQAVRYLLALLLLIAGTASARAETVFRVEYHPDPCQQAAALGKGKTATVGKVSISLEPFYYAACERVRVQIVDSIQARAEAFRGDLEADLKSRVAPLYDGFLKWMSLELYDRLSDADKARIKPEEHFREWLQNPDQELSTYVNYYMTTRMPLVAAAIERYQNDSSREIVDGLKGLWDTAQKRLSDIDGARRDLEEAAPDTKYTDILRKHGLSGDWIDRLQGYEGQFDLLDKNYSIVDTARTIHGAFTAESYSGRLEGMFTLMEKFGGYLSDSSVPGVSLLGTLIEAYGQMAKEVLARANELEKLIRAREGFCIGMATHTLLDARSKALEAITDAGVQACPLDEKAALLKDIYVQTDPQDADQLFFWLDGNFVKGRKGGGGEAGLRAARAFIRDAAGIGFAEFVGKDADMKTVIAVYNTPYGPEHYLADIPGHTPSPGLTGLVAEGDAVVDAIVQRIRDLRDHLRLDDDCGDDAFSRLIENETGLRLSAFPLDDGFGQQKLKTSYALGFIQSHAAAGGAGASRSEAYRRYRDVWQRLKFLSLVRIGGQLLDRDNQSAACEKCASATVSLNIANGAEMAGCRVTAADEEARFTGRIVTRSAAVSLQPQATVGDVTSEPAPIDARHLGLEGAELPFLRSFDVNLFMPFESEGDIEEALNALRGLHGQAQGAAGQGRAACSSGRAAALSLKVKGADIKTRIAALKQDLERLRPQLATLGQDVAQAGRLVSDAEAAAKKAVEAKQEAEKSALAACDKTAELRKETDEALQRNLMTEVRSAAADAGAKARVAAAGHADAVRAATSAEEIAKNALPVAEAASRLPGRLAEINALVGEIEALPGQISDQATALGKSLETVTEIEPRAKAAHAAVLSLAQSADDPDAARAEAGRLLEAIRGIAAELKACLGELEKAGDDLKDADPAKDLSDTSAAIDAIAKQSDGQSPADLLETRASTARASADVAEIFAEAAESAAADAGRCLDLGQSALTEGRADDLAAAADAAIAQCRFPDAQQLLQNMTGHPRYSELASAYQSAVEREARTKAEYDRAQSLFKSGDLSGALAALDAARAITACDGFRATIDAAIANIKGQAGDSLVAEARAAIAACEFASARDKVAELGEAGHPSYTEVKADYDTAVEREARTNSLWSQARAAAGQGKPEEALALLQSARGNTQCSDFASRIEQAIAALGGAAAPPPGAGPEPSAGLTQPWAGEIRMTRLFVNGSEMNVGSMVNLLTTAAQRAKQKAEEDETILEGMAATISDAIIAIVAVVLRVLEEGLPVSFMLVPEGPGYRLAPIGDLDEGTQQSMAQIPLFVPVEEGLLRMNYTSEDGNARIVATAELNDAEDQLSLTVQFDGSNDPDDSLYSDLSTARIILTGAMAPGAVPAAQIQAEITKRVEAAMRKYAPDLVSPDN
jgi:hypothetical protein